MGNFKQIIFPIVLTSSIFLFFVFIEPDYDSSVVLVMIVSSIMLMSGIPMNFLGKLAIHLKIKAILVIKLFKV